MKPPVLRLMQTYVKDGEKYIFLKRIPPERSGIKSCKARNVFWNINGTFEFSDYEVVRYFTKEGL